MLEDTRQEMNQLRNRKEECDKAREILEEEVHQLKREIFLLQEKNQLLNKRNAALESELKNVKVDYNVVSEARTGLNSTLSNQNDYVIQMEEKIYKSNKISLELIKQLKDAEVEIDCLKQYIIDLKVRVAVYIPVQDDPIDKRLAEFINNYPEKKKLKLMFMREQQGLYLFGSRKVTVKLENK